MLDHCDRLSPTLREAIGRRLGVSQGTGWEASPPDWEEVLRTWYRQLVLNFHPDRGGSTKAYHRLRTMVGLALAESPAGRGRGT